MHSAISSRTGWVRIQHSAECRHHTNFSNNARQKAVTRGGRPEAERAVYTVHVLQFSVSFPDSSNSQRIIRGPPSWSVFPVVINVQ
jgi:hypothetical protein